MLVKDICAIKTNNYNKRDNWSYFNYLDTSNLIKNTIISIEQIESEDKLPSRAKQKVSINDILYSSVRPNQEHYGFIDKKYDNLLVSTGFIILKPMVDKVVPKFLYYYLTQEQIVNRLQNIAQNNTSSYPSITKEDILNLKIHLPSLKKQKEIVIILNKINDQIALNNYMVKRLQVLGKTIYCKNLDFSNKEKLASKAIITTGKEDANHASINGKYKFFTCSDDVLSCDDFKFEGKSVLVAGNGNFNVKYYEGKFNAYQRTYVIKNDSIIGNLYYTLVFNTEVFRKKSNGSIIKFITIEMLNNIDIPQFSKETNHLLNKILFKINIVDDDTYRLKQLKNKLLPLLINGQLQ